MRKLVTEKQTVVTRFQEQVAKYPDCEAVVSERVRLSYRTLNSAANRVARAIMAKTNKAGTPVGLLLSHDHQAITAVIGVLKTGNIYVPLDACLPRKRLAYLVKDAGALLVVTTNEHLALAVALSDNIINIDDIKRDVRTENPDLVILPESPAYIIYTSGSTGQPKGVYNSHQNMLYQVESYTRSIGLGNRDRHSMLQSFGFSRTLKEIFAPLLNGATLCMYDIKHGSFSLLADWLEKERISVFGSAITTYRLFMDSLPQDRKFQSLRLVYLGAEPFYKKDVEKFRQHFSPGCRLVHGMGATETGTFLRHIIDAATRIRGNTVPAGHPISGMTVLLLDDVGRPVPQGETGELVIKSEFLSLGYWGKPDLTRSRFHPDPEGGGQRSYYTGDLAKELDDGTFVHLGRKDYQLKIHGHRVAVPEIEGALHNVPGIQQAVVTAGGETGRKDLYAHIALKAGVSLSSSEIRLALSDDLPDHMIPYRIIFHDNLPATPNGKIDRRALSSLSISATPPSKVKKAIRLSVHDRLAAVWAGVLGLNQPIDPHDGFFDLGGDSIRYLELIMAIEEEFGIRFSSAEVLNMQTIREFSECITGYVEMQRRNRCTPIKRPFCRNENDGLIQAVSSFTAGWDGPRLSPGSLFFGYHRDGCKPPIFWLVNSYTYMKVLADSMDSDQPFYAIRSVGTVIRSQREKADPLIQYLVQQILDLSGKGRFFLGGHCSGARLAVETALEIEKRGTRTDLLILHDPPLDICYEAPCRVYYNPFEPNNPYQRFPNPFLGLKKRFPGLQKCVVFPSRDEKITGSAAARMLADIQQASISSSDRGADTQESPMAEPLALNACQARISVSGPVSLGAGTQASIRVEVVNQSPSMWKADPKGTISIANHWYSEGGELLQWLDGCTPLPKDLPPGSKVSVMLTVTSPIAPGNYVLECDLVDEGIRWFGEDADSAAKIRVFVGPEQGKTGIEQKLAMAYLKQGNRLFRLGSLDRAIARYRLAMNADGEKPVELYLMLARALKKSKDLPGALAVCKESSALGIADHNIHFVMAQLYEETGRLERALDYYLKAMDIFGKTRFFCSRVGFLFLALNKTEQSQELFRHGVFRFPDSDELQFGLACVNLRQGDRLQAETYIRNVLKINPDFIKRIPIKDHMLEGIIALASISLKMTPGNIFANDIRSLALKRMGKTSLAAAEPH